MNQPHWVITYRQGESGVKLILGSGAAKLTPHVSRPSLLRVPLPDSRKSNQINRVVNEPLTNQIRV